MCKIKFNCSNCNQESECYPNQFLKSVNHFCSRSCAITFNNRARNKRPEKFCTICKSLIKGKSDIYCSHSCRFSDAAAMRLIADDLSPRMAKRHLQEISNNCSICHTPNIWNDLPIIMILDHIDGNSENNSMSNLRLVCPNCDSQLPTYKNKNKGNGRFSRRQRYYDNKSY